MNIPDKLIPVLLDLCMAGGRSYLVGGCVRDTLMGVPHSDYDIEVYGLDKNTFTNVLRNHGRLDLVGESFEVQKLTIDGEVFDFSLPRVDIKIGIGRQAFHIEYDPELPIEKAMERRDFTINTIMYDVANSKFIDHFGGREDIEHRILRCTSSKFAEDPLRVLRGMQFAGRFGLRMTDESSVEQCRLLAFEYHTLPKERIWGEWSKWAEKSSLPSAGLDFLEETGWLGFYPDIMNLIGCPQDPIWHPEGDAYQHTKHVCDAMARICDREGVKGEDRSVLMLAALTHDVGKPYTTVFERDRWRSPAHAEVGVPYAELFLKSIGAFPRIIKRVLPLVREHMIACCKLEDIGPRMVRRLIVRLEHSSLRELLLLIEADNSGRPPLPAGAPPGAIKIKEVSENLHIPSKIEPIVKGRDLLKLGWKPGKEMGDALKECFQRQLDGEVSTVDEGIKWILSHQE